ncbi:MAG TPA: dihydroorotate dehydrogenase electron transfer subunit [Mycobacteriales bacterium]|jgi:dihydroorotate dehydrogenase electron transfer subunit|nr:dihydroorotate dehydrogenase electron transfer subunit [Mycobacteriales bacterium]
MGIQVKGEVLNVKPVGEYFSMTVVAPGIAELTKPGQFVAVAVGGDGGGMLLRRAFSIYSVRETGVYGGTVEFIFSVSGRGTAWLAAQRPYDPIDVVGPLGRPFALPREPANCVLVGGGYGAAPLFMLADALRTRGCRIDAVLGASTGDRLFGALDAKRMAASVAFTTDDGSYGEKGRVSDVLPEVIERVHADVVYACGPMAMLQAVQSVASAAYDGAGIPTQLSVEESMACGIGVCMTCVLPIIGNDGQTRMARSCADGPVFSGERIRWDALGTVPNDAVGAQQ